MCRHGENIYHRKDGRWEARFPIGKRSNGTTKFKSVFGRTYNEAKARKYRALMEWLDQHPSCSLPGSAVSFGEFATKWLEEEVLGTVKPSTYQTYLGTLKNQLLPYFMGYSLDAITPARIQEFLCCMEERGMSASTRKSAICMLNSILRHAQYEGIIRKNPCRKIRVIPDREEQRVFSPEELKRIRESGDCLAVFALCTGLRLGEICALRWSDIDWNHRTVLVRRTAQRIRRNGQSAVVTGSPKTRKSLRIIPLPEVLVAMLKAWRGDHGGTFIFGKCDSAADPRTVQRRFARLLKRLEISGGHFHTLRHSFATRMMQLGMDVKTVSTLLGHSTVRTTMDFYVHDGLDELQSAMDRLASSL